VSNRPRRRERPAPAQAALIHGRNAVLEAARAGQVVKVFQASGLGHDPRLDELARLAPIEVVAPDRLDAIASGVHQGVAAELKPRRAWTLKELLDTRPTLLVALDGIMDPQNLGAILRSAEVAGADGAILPEHRSAPLSPAAVKASSGASELLRIAQEARKSGSENPRTQNSRTTAVKTRLDSARRPQRERKGCVGLETKSVA